MPIKLNEILFHLDLDSSYGEIRFKYAKPVQTPYDIASISATIPPPEYLESEIQVEVSFFSKKGNFKVIPEVGKSGVYLLCVRPNYRLKNLVVDDEEIVVDVYANKHDSITYSFYNPTRRSSFSVSGQLVEDIDGFYRKITTYPDDPVWRQAVVRRSMASFDDTSNDGKVGHYPVNMTAEQIAEYLQVEVKTIRKWTSEGRIPHAKLGSLVRFSKAEIESAIKAGLLKDQTGKAKKSKGVTKSKQEGAKKS